MPEYLIYVLVILAIQLLAFVVILLVWKSDCKSHKKENLDVSLGERLLLLVMTLFIPMWVTFFMKISDDLNTWLQCMK